MRIPFLKLENTSLRPLLPVDVLLKIALWIEDATSFFAFLESLGTAHARGSLDSLWQLRSAFLDRDHLWPSLHLTDQILANHLEGLKSALFYVPHIVVLDLVDIGWLHQHVSPSTTISWEAAFPTSPSTALVHGILVDLEDWFHMWAKLSIANLTVMRPDHNQNVRRLWTPTPAIPTLFEVLPSCHRLVRLKLECPFCLSAVFELAATSTSLIDLALVSGSVYIMGSEPRLNATHISLAMQWLNTAPVERLRLSNVYLASDLARNVLEMFLTTLFTCPTMMNLQLSTWDLASLDSSIFPTSFGLLRLKFSGIKLTPTTILCLCRVLRHSIALKTFILTKLRRSQCTDAHTNNTSAFQELFESIAQSNIKTLDVSNCRLDDTHWPQLGQSLQRCTLESIRLDRNYITDEGAYWIARAIQANETIHSVSLRRNTLTFKGVKELLDINILRQVPLRALGIDPTRKISNDEKGQLHELAKLTGVDLSI
ncbi:Aste57867_2378 [Aphanomyces stellatus]|uniref:Aste57867_2378 protein n=1 Tax=Aphanomyces stellatus TaxID=120398 RepID=A0A485KD34_9STRA|nr:hypothetical protein As57867_002372 [Aphanomyces stellatus]VFT79579.1 Aste57867_2378 [Aphanomyces stellatus]